MNSLGVWATGCCEDIEALDRRVGGSVSAGAPGRMAGLYGLLVKRKKYMIIYLFVAGASASVFVISLKLRLEVQGHQGAGD